jgi:hypothetical protein
VKPWLWALTAGLASSLHGLAQCDSFADPVVVSNVTVQTVGGITSVHFTYSTYCLFELWKKPVLVQETNITQRVWLVPNFSLICPEVYPPIIYETNATIVLGRFAPGAYLCRLLTPNSVAGPRLLTIPFTVPEPAATISLLSAPSGQIAFRVEGTSNLTYQIESSSTLTNWMPIVAHTGGPVMFTNALIGNSFYRARVSDGVSVCTNPP